MIPSELGKIFAILKQALYVQCRIKTMNIC